MHYQRRVYVEQRFLDIVVRHDMQVCIVHLGFVLQGQWPLGEIEWPSHIGERRGGGGASSAISSSRRASLRAAEHRRHRLI